MPLAPESMIAAHAGLCRSGEATYDLSMNDPEGAMVKAIQVHEYGGPEVLAYADVDVPPPGAGEVRVRHAAIGVNFIDVYFRSGQYKAPALPFTPGNEGAGVVVAVGDGVTGFEPGDRVAYAGALGGYAEE